MLAFAQAHHSGGFRLISINEENRSICLIGSNTTFSKQFFLDVNNIAMYITEQGINNSLTYQEAIDMLEKKRPVVAHYESKAIFDSELVQKELVSYEVSINHLKNLLKK